MAAEAQTGTRRREESERRRQSILEAARRCFGRDGYAGATVAHIAREAGVSTGLLYQFFRNKDHLLEVVLQDVLRDWVRAMVPDDPDESALDALEGMLRRSVAFCRNHPLLPALMARDPALRLQKLSPVAVDRIEPHRRLVASILARGVERGELRADLDVASSADLICQIQSEYSRRAYVEDPLFPLTEEILDAAVSFTREAVRAR
ncbi:MAG: TetR/AcrR family transcriptional regulator [Myxococcota bacterium]|nr:TetR/AcrR family transcriptional regulator [Myxococcota bacterium]